MVVRNVKLYGAKYTNGFKQNGFAKAILEEGQEVYLGEVTGLSDAYKKCDELGHDTTRIRERTFEWIKTGIMPD